MPIKQVIDNHPVMVYGTAVLVAFAAGFGAYDTVLRVAGRSIVPTADVEKIAKYESIAAEVAGLKKALAEKSATTTAPAITVRPGPVMVKSTGCTGDYFNVVERFDLIGDSDPANFIMLGEASNGDLFEARRLNDKEGVVKAVISPPGWIVSYCAYKGQKSEHYRRFINYKTGGISSRMLVRYETQ